jgi:hypothetical protein
VFDFINYPNIEDYRLSFDDLINKCVNIELMDDYNLSAFSTIENCMKADDIQPLGKQTLQTTLPTFSRSSLHVSSKAEVRLILSCLASVFEDNLEVFGAALIISIVVIVLISSVFDTFLRRQDEADDDHYKNKLKLESHRVLTIFSVKRNWKILAAPTKNDAKDLRFIEFIRTFGIFGTIYSHTVLYNVMTPLANPIYIDAVSLMEFVSQQES